MRWLPAIVLACFVSPAYAVDLVDVPIDSLHFRLQGTAPCFVNPFTVTVNQGQTVTSPCADFTLTGGTLTMTRASQPASVKLLFSQGLHLDAPVPDGGELTTPLVLQVPSPSLITDISTEAGITIWAGRAPGTAKLLAHGVVGDNVNLVLASDFEAASGTSVAFRLATVAPTPDPECSDALDNDGDAKVDLLDPDCSSPTDDSELPAFSGGGGCGFGPELAGVMPLLARARRLRLV